MDTVKELQAKKMSLLEDMQRIGDKITKEIGTQTSRGYDCDGPDSEGNEVNDFEAGSCDKENENDNSVPVSDLSEQEKAMKLPGERGKTILISNSYSSSSTNWNLGNRSYVETNN